MASSIAWREGCEGDFVARKRQTQRQTACLPAWIEVGDNGLLEHCKLLNISGVGATLRLGFIDDLPETINLYLSRLGQPLSQCGVVWQPGSEVGVKFDNLVSGIVSPVPGTCTASCSSLCSAANVSFVTRWRTFFISRILRGRARSVDLPDAVATRQSSLSASDGANVVI
jgi:hypothetical protein